MQPAGLAHLRTDEGCTLTAIPDPLSPLAKACKAHGIAAVHFRNLPGWERLSATPWTIGYGCTGEGIGPSTVWSQARADSELLKRVQQYETALQHGLPWITKLSPVRQDVLCDMAFNLGVAGLLKWKLTLGAIQRGDYTAARADILADHLWERQVGEREKRCADAMGSGMW